MRTSPRVLLLILSAGILVLSADGQQGSVTFMHFKTYPSGQWSQRLQTYRNGAPSGPPQTAVSCAGPLSASQSATVTKLGKDAASLCRTKILMDTEQTAEYEQVCDTGSQQQVMHSRMRALDDQTISVEVRHSIGGQEISTAKITSRYVGTCPADQSMPETPDMPAIPKPSADECGELPAMRQQAKETGEKCTTPEFTQSEQASCKAAMQRLIREVEQMEVLCKE